jgi:hypothetical protein
MSHGSLNSATAFLASNFGRTSTHGYYEYAATVDGNSKDNFLPEQLV